MFLERDPRSFQMKLNVHIYIVGHNTWHNINFQEIHVKYTFRHVQLRIGEIIYNFSKFMHFHQLELFLSQNVHKSLFTSHQMMLSILAHACEHNTCHRSNLQESKYFGNFLLPKSRKTSNSWKSIFLS